MSDKLYIAFLTLNVTVLMQYSANFNKQ